MCPRAPQGLFVSPHTQTKCIQIACWVSTSRGGFVVHIPRGLCCTPEKTCGFTLTICSYKTHRLRMTSTNKRTRRTANMCQAPVPSHPRMTYPVRRNRSLRQNDNNYIRHTCVYICSTCVYAILHTFHLCVHTSPTTHTFVFCARQ